MWKYTIDDVKEILAEKGYTLISDNYEGKHSKIEYVDSIGYKYWSVFNNLTKGNIPEIFGRSNPHTIENIRLWIVLNNKNVELLSKDFGSAKMKIEWKCLVDGNIFFMAWDSIRSDRGCPVCKGVDAGNRSRVYSIDAIKKTLTKIRPDAEILELEYTNSSSPLKCKCLKCGQIYTASWSNLRIGKKCRKCYVAENKGENHYNYDSSKTDGQREQDRSAHKCKEWITQVFERDDYTCQCCGKKGAILRAHHIEGFNWAINKRNDVENGVMLCSYCHDSKYKGSFHGIYGNGYNTKDQLKEFLLNYKNGIQQLALM